MGRNVEALTSATMAQAKAQMAQLFGFVVDKSALETGGAGRCYVKVWRDAPVALYLWFWFEPGAAGEQIAYERAVQAMSDNPGARWAVSGQCGHACAGLPRMWLQKLGDGSLPDFAVAALEELCAAKGRSLIVGEHDASEYLALADACYAFEVEPSKWRATEAGKRFVEARRDEARAAMAEAANG